MLLPERHGRLDRKRIRPWSREWLGRGGDGTTENRQLRPLSSPRGDHGATLPNEEGQAAFCAFGHPVGAQALPLRRQIDVPPTVADWLRMPPPRHATGRSVLEAVLRE